MRKTFFTTFCRLDARSLVLFRIGLGYTIICNLWELWPNRYTFLGEDGVNPIHFFYNGSHLHLRWSFLLNDNHCFILVHFLLQAVFALMLMIGWRTRMAAFWSWLLEISLLNRMTAFSYGADQVLVCYLMWAMFLPLGSRWSVDRMLAGKKAIAPVGPSPESVVSIAAFCLIYQVAVIYCMSGYTKTDPLWTKEHTALSFVLHDELWATPLGLWLGHFPTVLKVLTWIVLFLERFGILLLFFPLWPAFWRGILVCVFILFQLGIGLTMSLGWFPLIMIVGWMALVPSSWWRFWPVKGASGLSVHDPKSVQAAAAMVLALVFFINGWFAAKHVFHRKFPQPILYMAVWDLGIVDQNWRFFAPPPMSKTIYSFEPLAEPPQLLDKASQEYKDITGWYDTVVIKSTSNRWKKFFTRADATRRNPLLNNYLLTLWKSRYPHGPAIKQMRINARVEPVIGH